MGTSERGETGGNPISLLTKPPNVRNRISPGGTNSPRPPLRDRSCSGGHTQQAFRPHDPQNPRRRQQRIHRGRAGVYRTTDASYQFSSGAVPPQGRKEREQHRGHQSPPNGGANSENRQCQERMQQK